MNQQWKTNESTSTSCNISFVRTRLKGWFRLRLSNISDVVAGGELDRIRFVISSVSSVIGARFNSSRYSSTVMFDRIVDIRILWRNWNRIHLSIFSMFLYHRDKPMKSSIEEATLFSSGNVVRCHYKIALSFRTTLPLIIRQLSVNLQLMFIYKC